MQRLKAGAPENCVQWITEPSMEATSALMNHEGVAQSLQQVGMPWLKPHTHVVNQLLG